MIELDMDDIIDVQTLPCDDDSWLEPDIGEKKGMCGPFWSNFLKSKNKQNNSTNR